MAHRVTYKANWVHVEYFDYVDSLDVIRQVNDNEFWAQLEQVKKVIFDYSGASQLAISLDDLKHFATIARVQAHLIGPVDVAAVIAGPERLENALAYKKYSENPNDSDLKRR